MALMAEANGNGLAADLARKRLRPIPALLVCEAFRGDGERRPCAHGSRRKPRARSSWCA